MMYKNSSDTPPEPYHCPICGGVPDDYVYTTPDGKIIGCDACIVRTFADEYQAD